MKIGILTYHSSYNFGANLQALSTQAAVEKLGGTAVIVDYRRPEKQEAYRSEIRADQAERHEGFFKKYLKLSPLLQSRQEVEEYVLDELDGVIVGSDAVFRLMPTYNLKKLAKTLLGRSRAAGLGESTRELGPYWLPWEPRAGFNPVRCAVAASSEGCLFFQVKWSLLREAHKCLRRFDLLTVRDDWTALMVRSVSRGSPPVELCPDPVFGLLHGVPVPTEENPTEDLRKTLLLSGKLPGEWVVGLQAAAERRGFRVGTLLNPDADFDISGLAPAFKRPIGPLQWFRLLGSCAAYIGIRFHAFVSCLAQGTPSIALDRVGRMNLGYAWRSKVRDLAKRAGVLERYGTVEGLPRRDPEEILDCLQNAKLQTKANEYAAHACVQFYNVVQRVLELTADRVKLRKSP